MMIRMRKREVTALGLLDPRAVLRVPEEVPLKVAEAWIRANRADEVFLCDTCGKEFHSRKSLYGHLKAHA